MPGPGASTGTPTIMHIEPTCVVHSSRLCMQPAQEQLACCSMLRYASHSVTGCA